MGMSNFTLKRIIEDMSSRMIGARISKIVKISNHDFSFFLYAKKQESLIISLDNNHPYMLLSSSYFKMISESNGFVASLKKYFEGGTIIDFKKDPNDKVVFFKIKKITQTYQTIVNNLIIELIPYRPNAIITDENNVIIDAVKKSSSLDETRPIFKGLKYKPYQNEIRELNEDDTLESVKEKVTKLIYNEFVYRVNNGESIRDIVLEKKNSTKYYVYKYDILSLNLKSVEGCKEITLEQLSTTYEEKEQEKYKKSHYELALHTVNHKLKGLKNKLVNLENDLKKAKSKIDYVEIGNLLFMNQDKYVKGMKEIIIDEIKIPLDDKLDLVGNANKYFKQYQKSKTALQQIKIQQELTKEKIDYFEKINAQIKYASVTDMEDILQELKKDGYLPKEKNQNNKKNKPKVYTPHYITSSDGFKIGFGISSYQNETLTFEIARKDDYFLHIKDNHGPHVIIFSNDPSKEAITLACEVAIYFANKTSGEVILLDKKDVKKVPSKIGMVTFSSHQTITLNSIRESSIELFKETMKK